MLWIFVLAIIMPIELGLCESVKSNKPNLSAITWDHAVNSWKELNATLASDVQMVEADVSIASEGKFKDLPVMAHSAKDPSDLSLEEFVQAFVDYNTDKEAGKVKGIKLDFKTIKAFTDSIPTLDKVVQDATFQIWLNADIIKGPVGAKGTPVDADEFLKGAAKFPNLTLSVGWTTTWGSKYKQGNYTEEHINNMLNALERNKYNETKHPITFPVRAGIAANSGDQMQRLIDEIPGSTLTIWSGKDDAVNVEELKKLILSIGTDRVYVDVPKHLSDQLDLNGPPANSSANTLHFGLLTLAIVLLCYFMKN